MANSTYKPGAHGPISVPHYPVAGTQTTPQQQQQHQQQRPPSQQQGSPSHRRVQSASGAGSSRGPQPPTAGQGGHSRRPSQQATPSTSQQQSQNPPQIASSRTQRTGQASTRSHAQPSDTRGTSAPPQLPPIQTSSNVPPPQRPQPSSTRPAPPPPPPPAPSTSAGGDAGQSSGRGQSQDTSGIPSAFPHAFERWEMLSSRWEGLTGYWISRLEQNQQELAREPLAQQMSRQITDLSAAGANLFHAVVELQRLRASSERKFQRWFFETRSDQERSREMSMALENTLRDERQKRADALNMVGQLEKDKLNAEKLVEEVRRELKISHEEARRAWEELGRREQEEREKQIVLRMGQPTFVGGIQVIATMLPGAMPPPAATSSSRPGSAGRPQTAGSNSAGPAMQGGGAPDVVVPVAFGDQSGAPYVGSGPQGYFAPPLHHEGHLEGAGRPGSSSQQSQPFYQHEHTTLHGAPRPNTHISGAPPPQRLYSPGEEEGEGGYASGSLISDDEPYEIDDQGNRIFHNAPGVAPTRYYPVLQPNPSGPSRSHRRQDSGDSYVSAASSESIPDPVGYVRGSTSVYQTQPWDQPYQQANQPPPLSQNWNTHRPTRLSDILEEDRESARGGNH